MGHAAPLGKSEAQGEELQLLAVTSDPPGISGLTTLLLYPSGGAPEVVSQPELHVGQPPKTGLTLRVAGRMTCQGYSALHDKADIVTSSIEQTRTLGKRSN